jgi:hypothetical protein
VNRYQKILLIVAGFNVAIIMLFPPFDALPLVRAGAHSFDGFYYVFGYNVNHTVNTSLLHLEVFLVLANVAAAWLLLDKAQDAQPGVNAQRTGIVAVMGVNLVLMLLFPPMENYGSLMRLQAPTFDGFYFIFGDKFHRNFYIPILYMEVSFVLINGALLSLLFGESERALRNLAPEQVAELAHRLGPEDARKLAKELQQQVLLDSLKKPRPLEDPPDQNDRRKRPRI